MQKMYKTLHKKQGSVTVQLRFARSSVTFCAKRDTKGGDGIVDLYRLLKNYADENNYEVIGNGYERDVLSHIVERDRTNYLVRCYIHVKRKENE